MASAYRTKFNLANKNDKFNKRATVLFWVIGKFIRLAKNVRIKLSDKRVKLLIGRFVKRWRAARKKKMQIQLHAFLEERVMKTRAFLRTAQVVFCHVVLI